ncbi:MAG: hypothetical protein HC768_16625 [Acaryochloris sp. CRU_2_0]|nr:hypothetical protein [Acaryochloris sp. CRU_2_0]
MNRDMLNRIKNKSQRPQVQRDTTLSGSDQPTQSLADQNVDIQSQVDVLPEVASRRNIRLLEGIDKSLNELCSREGITIETFLEASFLACDRNPELLASVLDEACQRLEERKKAGKLRRLYSQLQSM